METSEERHVSALCTSSAVGAATAEIQTAPTLGQETDTVDSLHGSTSLIQSVLVVVGQVSRTMAATVEKAGAAAAVVAAAPGD